MDERSLPFIPVSRGPGVHSGIWTGPVHENCNGLCAPPRHVEILWCHPRFRIEEVTPESFDRTFRMWIGCSARLVGRAELPPREEDGWIPWTVEVTTDEP